MLSVGKILEFEENKLSRGNVSMLTDISSGLPNTFVQR